MTAEQTSKQANEQTSKQTSRPTNKQFEQAMNPLITEPIQAFLGVAQGTGLSDEQAIVSLTATMFIRYSNLCDKNPNFNELVKSLKQSAERSNMVLEDMLLVYYDPLIRSSKKLGEKVTLYIKSKTKEPVEDFKAFDEGLRDYVSRNGYEFEYICALTPVISKEE